MDFISYIFIAIVLGVQPIAIYNLLPYEYRAN